jgi:hypothetical protein
MYNPKKRNVHVFSFFLFIQYVYVMNKFVCAGHSCLLTVQFRDRFMIQRRLLSVYLKSRYEGCTVELLLKKISTARKYSIPFQNSDFHK